jgi:alkanesulfonate monooxygenase SsuD/methylene tetrahydromethanopterin reductase-like flavin-dependent oxidoreductase (luciferase family)
MKLGLILPQVGPAASAEAIVSLAKRAEGIGYDSLWVTDRLLYPVQPQNPYPGTPEARCRKSIKLFSTPF